MCLCVAWFGMERSPSYRGKRQSEAPYNDPFLSAVSKKQPGEHNYYRLDAMFEMIVLRLLGC